MAALSDTLLTTGGSAVVGQREDLSDLITRMDPAETPVWAWFGSGSASNKAAHDWQTVALAGPIGFIGLTAPHIGRALVGGNHCRLLPASGLVGAITLLACDVVGRVIGGLAEVPVGVVLATLGGVAFVVIVRRTKLAAL